MKYYSIIRGYAQDHRWNGHELHFASTGLPLSGSSYLISRHSRWLNSLFLLPFGRRARSSDYRRTKVKAFLRETRSRLGYRLQGCRQPSFNEDDMSRQIRQIIPVIREYLQEKNWHLRRETYATGFSYSFISLKNCSPVNKCIITFEIYFKE